VKFSLKKVLTPAMIAGISMICLQGVPAAGATDASVLTLPHTAPLAVARSSPRPLTTAEARWNKKEGVLLDQEQAANTDLTDLLTQAGDDVTVVFDSTWNAEVNTALDTFDTVYAKQRRINAPTARTRKIEKQYDIMFREMSRGGADLRSFLDTYDTSYADSASAHIDTATKAATRVTALLTAITPTASTDAMDF
jgi:hypothetical protein